MEKLITLSLLLPFLSHAFATYLSPYYYARTCPSLEYVVGRVVVEAVYKDPRMAASLLRLHFHDCFVHGCDASILLDDTDDFQGEKLAGPNINSIRGYDLIDEIKAEVEKVCEGIVSCADILALAAREAVLTMRGPFWHVEYGRRDSKTASKRAANHEIPGPNSNASVLIEKFSNKGLSAQDLVVLSGAHSIGFTRCSVFKDRVYDFRNTGEPDPTLNAYLLGYLRGVCPDPESAVDNTVSGLDVHSPFLFDVSYYRNLLVGKGMLFSDQTLHSGENYETQFWVGVYSSQPYRFFRDFGYSMLKMGRIQPLTESSGEVRKYCRAVNA